MGLLKKKLLSRRAKHVNKQEASFRAAGYIPGPEAAALVQVDLATLYRWESSGLKCMKSGNHKYVERASLIAYLGAEKAAILGLTNEVKKAAGAKR